LNIVRYEAPPPAQKINDFGAFLLRSDAAGFSELALLGAQMSSVKSPMKAGTSE